MLCFVLQSCDGDMSLREIKVDWSDYAVSTTLMVGNKIVGNEERCLFSEYSWIVLAGL